MVIKKALGNAARASYFESVDPRPDFPVMEKELLKEWYDKGIVQKYLDRNKNSKKYFSFLDGPITANNPMGVHHGWGRTYKDLWPRFYSMRGYKQRHQNGFDCQGLWVEVEVEKELGLKSKKDIENLIPGNSKKSIAKFVNLCKERVFRFAEIQTDQSKRLGYFADWENSYYTLSDDNNYMIWHFLKKCFDRGLIYKGRDSVPWCPRCGTAISQHEMLTEDYKEVVHESVYFKLPLVDRKDEFLLVWTTTPWTIPANIAVAVDPKLEYSQVQDDGGFKYWVATDSKERLFNKDCKVIKKAKGKELVGLKYKGPFDNLPAVKKVREDSFDKFHIVIASDPLIMPISPEEGTGLVHTAVSAGSEDFKMGKQLGLPMIDVIDEEANYLDGFGQFTGKNAKNNPRLILDYLANEIDGANFLFKIEKYKHRYPACWRCKTELVWRVVDEWYISINPLREDMKKITKKINWIPSFGKKRELDWLNNMHDWLISKKRYWGLALPIWECECGEFEVIGGKEELEKRAVKGWDKFKGNSPHRPWVDEVKIKCSKCNNSMDRVKDVGNPWLDAGIVAYSTISDNNYAANPHKKGKPLFISDKNKWLEWFPVDFITESFPGQFKNWFYSLIAMSTVLTNKEPFKTVLGYATLVDETGRPMHKSWGNSIEFNEGADKMGVDVMRWMYARQNPKENLLFGYKVADEVRRKFHLKLWNSFNYFVTYANLNSWIPTSRANVVAKGILDRWVIARLKYTTFEVTSNLEKYDAYAAVQLLEELLDDVSNWYIRRSRGRSDNDFFKTIYTVLLTFTKLIAPINPFVADVIYKSLTKEESVHLSRWPDVKKLSNEEENIIANMRIAREIAEKGHSARKEAGIALKQPLAGIKIKSMSKLDADILELLQDELNVKAVHWTKGDTPTVILDTKLTTELIDEGKTRDLIRKIQETRKKQKVDLSLYVDVCSEWVPDGEDLISMIKSKTLTKNIKKGKFKVEPL